MLRSILVGLDGSRHSKAAIQLAIRWAQRYDAIVVGIGVVDEPAICRPEPVPIGGGYFKHERDEALLADAGRRVDRFLRAFAKECSEQGVNCTAMKRVGGPAPEIAERARSHDLVMLGRETHFRFETQDSCDDTLRQVLRQSLRPVVAVPKRWKDKPRTLIAYNGSRESDRALQAFEALGLGSGCDIQVASFDSSRDEAERLTEQAVEFLQLHGLKAIAHASRLTDQPGAMILEHARKMDSGLIVMGAFGRSRWREAVFGSTTREILDGSPAPVLLCH
jgi:nucleotide-binding universal stress UspA family protein